MWKKVKEMEYSCVQYRFASPQRRRRSDLPTGPFISVKCVPCAIVYIFIRLPPPCKPVNTNSRLKIKFLSSRTHGTAPFIRFGGGASFPTKLVGWFGSTLHDEVIAKVPAIQTGFHNRLPKPGHGDPSERQMCGGVAPESQTLAGTDLLTNPLSGWMKLQTQSPPP